MSNVAIDLDNDIPFNYTEIIRKTDEFFDMIEKLDICYPVLFYFVKKHKELKNRINIVRDRKPHLFSD